jgi:hypothetical protein
MEVKPEVMLTLWRDIARFVQRTSDFHGLELSRGQASGRAGGDHHDGHVALTLPAF